MPKRATITGAAALAIIFASTGAVIPVDAVARADGCYNGVTVLDPYGNTCTLPGPVHKVRGSAPDASAIIACRHHPGCLSWYVNNP
jgi:hypothetical protein